MKKLIWFSLLVSSWAFASEVYCPQMMNTGGVTYYFAEATSSTNSAAGSSCIYKSGVGATGLTLKNVCPDIKASNNAWQYINGGFLCSNPPNTNCPFYTASGSCPIS